jgi:hypothetical protein
MSDDAPGILRAAEHDLGEARRLLGEHALACTDRGCGDCVSLTAHVHRCERQVGLLKADELQPEALW